MRAALLVLALAALVPAAASAARPGGGGGGGGGGGTTSCTDGTVAEQLANMLEAVKSADGYRYGARDNQGVRLDTLKIVRGSRGYLGTSHNWTGDRFETRLSQSSNLLDWSYRTTLAQYAAQPSLTQSSDGSFTVAWETAEPNGTHHIDFASYADEKSLLAGSRRDFYGAPRTLSTGHEGTPSFRESSAGFSVGFHYYDASAETPGDRNAIGTLSGFPGEGTETWATVTNGSLNEAVAAVAAVDHIGDRDFVRFRGCPFTVVEAHLTSDSENFWKNWRLFLYDETRVLARPLSLSTHAGSSSFGNPAVTIVPASGGKSNLVVTTFLFHEGAAAGEAGELVYYRRY